MVTTDKSQNDIIDAWQSLIEKSVKANTAFLEESAKIFTSLLSKKIDTKDLLKIDTEAFNAAANNFIKLNIANTENLVNFGLNISRSFFSFIDTKNNTDANSSQHTESPSTKPRSQINLSVKQGEQISTSFYLNSHNAFSQTGKFYYEDFIDEATAKQVAIAMLISPGEFTLEPGKSLKIDISLDVKNEIIPGKYKSTVRLDGMDNQEFDIVVDVAENHQAGKQVVKPVAATRKTLPKKALIKNPGPKKTATKNKK